MSNTKCLVGDSGGRERRRRFVWGGVVAMTLAGILCATVMAGMLCLLYSQTPG